MKGLRGAATALTAAPVQECIDFLAAIEGYPSWYPEVVKSVEVLEQDPAGYPSKARAVLHLSRGPLVKDFDVVLDISVAQASTVSLVRIPHDRSDQERFEVSWHVHADVVTRLEVVLSANLSVPRLLPLGGIGDAIAGGFVTAASRTLG